MALFYRAKPKVADGEAVDAPIREGGKRLARRTHDGLLVDVEAGVEDERDARELAVALDKVPVQGIAVAADDLRTRRAVDMHDGGHPRAPRLAHVEGDG